MKKPLILVTNDDGIHATGIAALIEVAREFGDVIVVAPEEGQSGMAHAITVKVPLRINTRVKEDGFEYYSVNGTPVDCVKLAVNQILPNNPDLLISGINHGSNASISVIYSGTMAAAIEGNLQGIPSIGFSLTNYSSNPDFTLAKNVVRKIIAESLEKSIPQGVCLNVNIPDISESEFKGIRACRQTPGVWREEFAKNTDPRGKSYYWLTGYFENFASNDETTDEWALQNNYAAVVPVQTDLTAHKAIGEINAWDLSKTKNENIKV